MNPAPAEVDYDALIGDFAVGDDRPLEFGKYKGETPSAIADSDPGYIVWMWENVKDPPCTEALYERCAAEVEDDDSDMERDYLCPRDAWGL